MHTLLFVLLPAECSLYWRLSLRGLATDLIRVTVVASFDPVVPRFKPDT